MVAFESQQITNNYLSFWYIFRPVEMLKESRIRKCVQKIQGSLWEKVSITINEQENFVFSEIISCIP